jgi:hypothetical protein
MNIIPFPVNHPPIFSLKCNERHTGDIQLCHDGKWRFRPSLEMSQRHEYRSFIWRDCRRVA